MTILVTGFDPFDGASINPAWEAVRGLPDEVAGTPLVKLQVPTQFGRSIETVVAEIERVRPSAVVCVGQAGGRTAITPERVAINVDDARIPDNAGAQPFDRPVVEAAPAAYFATLPVKAMVAAIAQAGVAGELSNTAGTFVCNHLMYGVLHHLTQHAPTVRGGFVHVPFIPEQVADRPGVPAMALPDITRGLYAALEAVLAHEQDLNVAMGATH